MSNPIRVEKNQDGSYQLHLETINGSDYGIIVNASRNDLEKIFDSINDQFTQELNDDLLGFVDDDSCEGCKI